MSPCASPTGPRAVQRQEDSSWRGPKKSKQRCRARALAFCLPVLRVASASRTQTTTAEGPRWQPNRMPAAPAAIPRRQQKKRRSAKKRKKKNKALASVETLASKSPGLAGGLVVPSAQVRRRATRASHGRRARCASVCCPKKQQEVH